MRFFSYFPFMIALALGVGTVFYVVTVGPPLFFKKEAEKEAYRVLPVEEKKREQVQKKEQFLQVHTVSMEPDGFKPRILIINAGDTVKWVNNDIALHWPASDPHPTHTGLAGFDPLADILPTESYSFRFNEPGVYGYHDHTQAVIAGVATLTGIVRVVEKQ